MTDLSHGTSRCHSADSGADPKALLGLTVPRRFTRPGVDPFDDLTWERRTARLENADGETIFEQTDVEVPASWSQSATNVVASKYFRGHLGAPDRESSVRQLVGRVVETIASWGLADGYFATDADAAAFRDELAWLLLHQRACFNSPVWFNVGCREQPQCSACFINSVEDDMASIFELARTEGMLFKYGSGAGCNLSTLRSEREPLSGGGTASGPVSFMRGYDAFAGVIKSGGTTRRAAKMVILDAEHPDIFTFVRAKEVEERKARALIEAGYDGGFNVPGGAYDSVFHQNANHSVRLTDDFFRAVLADDEWTTRAVSTGEPMDTFPARDLLTAIAEATWFCGDPGVQYDSTINSWHTCSEAAPIRASNPCSEFMFLDDTACNLASINLARFHDAERDRFDVDGFRHACEIMITAQEILVDNAGYPTPKIAANSHAYRPLGLGYANLGALLMARGLAYDSAAGRHLAAAVTALMTGSAYAQSGRIAAARGPFDGFERNRRPMLAVLSRHRDALGGLDSFHLPLELREAARAAWDEAITLGEANGVRNSQISVLAPTGTIAFMMDCDTTGIEPDIALVKYKSLVGGGLMKIVNHTVAPGLRRLGYDEAATAEILGWVDEHDTIEGAPGLAPEHLPVFDCALEPSGGGRSIRPGGHLEMMAAVQPFLSGAISKTINLPEAATPEQIADVYVEGWHLGLKAVAIYRDGCKRSQPLSTRKQAPATVPEAAPARRKLPDERHAITHKFSVGGHEGYLTVGMYEDGAPGEIFLVMAKEGSTISGLMDAFATSISITLQYGVPLRTLIDKFSHTRFEPSGFTGNPEIPIAKSITDYIFRWLASRFLDSQGRAEVGIVSREPLEPVEAPAARGPSEGSGEGGATLPQTLSLLQQDAPACAECGAIMVRNGTCYKCLNCGSTSGCS